MESAIEKLPEEFRAVVVLAFYEGFAYQEIADILAIRARHRQIAPAPWPQDPAEASLGIRPRWRQQIEGDYGIVNCREALAKLYDYLDKELSEDDVKGLEVHIEHCSDCLKRYELEEEFNNVIKQKTACCPDVTHLKNRIREQIDKIDSASQPRNILFLLGPLVIAAVVALIIFVPFGKGSDPQAVLLAVRPLSDEHTKCLQQVMRYQVQSHDPAVIEAGLAQIPDLPEELFRVTPADVAIQAAAITHLQGGEDAHIDFRAYGEDVSVFVLPSSTIEKKPFNKVTIGSDVFYTGSCPNYQYVIWTCEGHECVAVSKLAAPKLLQFAQLF